MYFTISKWQVVGIYTPSSKKKELHMILMTFTEQDALGFNTKIMFILQAKSIFQSLKCPNLSVSEVLTNTKRCTYMGQNI